MKTIFLFLILFFTLNNLLAQTYDNKDRYVDKSITLNAGITWTMTHNLRHTPMNSFGMNIYDLNLEYNTDRFLRLVDGFVVQQINIGYNIDINRRKLYNDQLTLFVGKFWEIDDAHNILQDKNVIGIRINSSISRRMHLWGKWDTNFNTGIGIGIRIGEINPLLVNTRRY